jgi:hypothetical protein
MDPNVTPPTLRVIGPDEIDFDVGGFDANDADWDIVVEGLAGSALARSSQELLDRWISSSGPESVREVLEDDQTLGGIAYGVVVRRISRYAFFTLPGQQDQVLGAQWIVNVKTSG